MKISFAGWLLVIVSVCLRVTDSSPTSRVPSQISTELQTGSPLLRTLTLPEDHVSLVPEKSPRSDESSRVTTSSYETGTSQETNSPHSRGVRSVTSKENQAPTETTVIPPTEQVSVGSTIEETSVVPVDKVTTAGLVTEAITGSFATEKTTSAPVDVVLNQRSLKNASGTVLIVLAKIEDQRRELGVTNYNVDEAARPMLPANIRENAEQCVQIQSTQRAMQEVLTDFKPYLDGLTAPNVPNPVKGAVRSLIWHISNLTSPRYQYNPTTTIETNVNSSEEVLCTLMTLQTQCEIIRQVLSDLKSCQ